MSRELAEKGGRNELSDVLVVERIKVLDITARYPERKCVFART